MHFLKFLKRKEENKKKFLPGWDRKIYLLIIAEGSRSSHSEIASDGKCDGKSRFPN